MNKKDEVLKIIENKINELSIKETTIKTDRDNTIEAIIEKISLGKEDLNISIDKQHDNYLLICMDHGDDKTNYSRKIKSNNVDEILNLICAILDSHNLNGAYIRQDEILKEVLGDVVFDSLFEYTDNGCYPSYFNYLKNTQARLDEFKSSIENLMMQQNLVQHILHESSIDNTKQRYWIKIVK